MLTDSTAQLAISGDIELARSGDQHAFSRLIEYYLKYMYRTSKAILYGEADAEDAIQETIIKAWTHLHKLENDDYFKTWLTRILVNECNNILRKRKKFHLTDQIFAVSENFAGSSERIELRDAINRLEEDLRTIVVLFYFEDLSQKEIAYIMKIPEGTVKSRLSRAKNKLSNLLEE